MLFVSNSKSVKTEFQIEVHDPYPTKKWRTDLGTLLVLFRTTIPLHIYRQSSVKKPTSKIPKVIIPSVLF